MKSCRKWRPHLVEALYDELAGERRTQLEAHLATCPGCAAELARLRDTADRVEQALPPRPRSNELDVWNRILPEIEKLDRPAEAPRRLVPRRLVLAYPVAAGLAMVLLVLGLGLGRLTRPPVPVPEAPPVTRVAGSDAQFVRYLERVTPLLLAVANRQAGGAEMASFDPAAERRLAERLASEAELLAQELEAEGRKREATLVTDLRIVFLQMANLPRREYRRGIEMVQATIESRALLFQLSVEEMRRL